MGAFEMKMIRIAAVILAVLCLSACTAGKTDESGVNSPDPTPSAEQTLAQTFPLGGQELEADATEATLVSGEYSGDQLLEQLGAFSAMQKVILPETELSFEQLDALRKAYPEIGFEYTVKLLDEVLKPDIAEIDLSGLMPEQVEDAVKKLQMLPELTQVELMNGDKCALSVEDVKLLRDGLPEASIHYVFELFGQSVSTTDERVEYDEVEIGNEGEASIRAALSILQDGTYVKFDDCGIDSEVMAGIRDDYPNLKVVWRVHCGYFDLLTDEEMVRAIFDLNDSNCHELKYCTEVKYMDIGHNDNLTDISFISYMPKLEILILSGSPFTDTTPFANCPNLEWFEIVWCGYVTDISSLENCPNLKYVNISHTQVTDLSALEDKPLERFVYYTPKVSADQEAEFIAQHPDCWVSFRGKNEYMKGWRYDDDAGGQPCEMYSKVREVFRYDENFYNHKGA